MKTYYTEYPKGQFKAASDEEAIKHNALVVYRESEVETEKIIETPTTRCM